MALGDMKTTADALRWALERIAVDNRGNYFDRATEILAVTQAPATAICTKLRYIKRVLETMHPSAQDRADAAWACRELLEAEWKAGATAVPATDARAEPTHCTVSPKPGVVCHASGPSCHGCRHYHGEAPRCIYAPDVATTAPAEAPRLTIPLGYWLAPWSPMPSMKKAFFTQNGWGPENSYAGMRDAYLMSHPEHAPVRAAITQAASTGTGGKS